MEALYIFLTVFVGLYLILFYIFWIVSPENNPNKKVSFWITLSLSSVVLTGGILFLVLLALGGSPKLTEGSNKTYYANGNLESAFFVKDGHMHGYRREWDSLGTLRLVEKYSNGSLQDSSIIFYSNGQMENLKIYSKNDLVHYFNYLENGQLKSEGHFNGESIRYYLNKQPSQRQKLKGWMIDGSQTNYYQNGNVKYTGLVKENLKDGIWSYLDSVTKQIIEIDTFNYKEHREIKTTWK